jgi:polysaccharide biosynthesis transport protein
LQDRFAQLRETKAGSASEELTRTVELARGDLDKATAALREVERRVGIDLAELRILNESPSGDSDLRHSATELKRELRTYQAAQPESEAFLKLLTAAKDDPSKLLASPSMLLKSQPALGRLKDGLVDAQLRTGQLLGTYSEAHPLVKGARNRIRAMGSHGLVIRQAPKLSDRPETPAPHSGQRPEPPWRLLGTHRARRPSGSQSPVSPTPTGIRLSLMSRQSSRWL